MLDASAHGSPTTSWIGPPVDPDCAARIRAHLEVLYPAQQAAETHAALLGLVAEVLDRCGPAVRRGLFDETDVILITYADQIVESADERGAGGEAPPLRTLGDFLSRHLAGTITGVHLLPFYPWTSDDGFAVVDHDRVDPNVGAWSDVTALAGQFRVMVDAVVNHVSSSSPWVTGWRSGEPAYDDVLIAIDPATDLSRVVRPRTHPLLTPMETSQGLRHVWTTFSTDQIDVNIANPAVLLALTRTLLRYIEHGAGIIRLDAVGFLWKEVGTSCLHLPRTHEVVRLWRTIVDAVAPGTLLVTETNVPHLENVRYFGDGTNEAHLVYQFPLAPLVLSAFLTGDSRALQLWARGLHTPTPQTSFLNFLGSHDGVGVRPAEGLLPDEEIDRLVEVVRGRGGGVSYRAVPGGHQHPYELNTVFYDALNGPEHREGREVQVRRFLAAQSILLALAGVPAIYVQALLGSRNWHEGVERTGRLRSINRRKFERAELERELADPASLRHRVFTELTRLIRVRTSQPAFHPNGAQRVLLTHPGLFVLERTAVDGSSGVIAVHEIAGNTHRTSLPVPPHARDGVVVDLATGERFRADPQTGEMLVPVAPYEVRWLRWDGT
jgi:glucosylglycerate phosphorylase